MPYNPDSRLRWRRHVGLTSHVWAAWEFVCHHAHFSHKTLYRVCSCYARRTHLGLPSSFLWPKCVEWDVKPCSSQSNPVSFPFLPPSLPSSRPSPPLPIPFSLLSVPPSPPSLLWYISFPSFPFLGNLPLEASSPAGPGRPQQPPNGFGSFFGEK